MKLAQKLLQGLREIAGVSIYCCDRMENHLSTVTVNVDGLDAADVGTMLDVDHNIATRTGLHCAPLVHKQIGTMDIHGGVRFSIGAFNTEVQIEAAIEALKEITRWKETRKTQPASKA
jgi:cysteine desulfurase / selenocysteine lyase